MDLNVIVKTLITFLESPKLGQLKFSFVHFWQLLTTFDNWTTKRFSVALLHFSCCMNQGVLTEQSIPMIDIIKRDVLWKSFTFWCLQTVGGRLVSEDYLTSELEESTAGANSQSLGKSYSVWSVRDNFLAPNLPTSQRWCGELQILRLIHQGRATSKRFLIGPFYLPLHECSQQSRTIGWMEWTPFNWAPLPHAQC